MKRLILIAMTLCLWSLGACAHDVAARNARPPPDPALAYVGGSAICLPDLSPEIQDRLTRLDDDWAQRRFALVWAGLEDAIAERLLQTEAARQHLKYDAFVHQHIDIKVGAPSEEEVMGLYAANQNIIGVPYAQAAPILRKQYQSERKKALRRALTDRLRGSNQVQYAMAAPNLDRAALRAAGPSLGPQAAAITLVVYSDFTCPYSAQARRLVKQLLERYPNQIRVVHQDYPLAQNSRAQAAAQAGHCAHEQHKFWAFYDTLFDSTKQLSADDLSQSARQAELDVAAFHRCMATDRPKTAVTQSRAEAYLAGVRGTPTFFVNGMRLSGVLPLPVMQAFIENELSRKPGREQAQQLSQRPGAAQDPA